jgi:hypothetical protein
MALVECLEIGWRLPSRLITSRPLSITPASLQSYRPGYAIQNETVVGLIMSPGSALSALFILKDIVLYFDLL